MTVRDNLITAATAFLSSPSVKDHPDETKRKFLMEKGLTNSEIIAAFAKSRNSVEQKPENFNQVMDRCLEENGHLKNKSAPTRPSAPILVVAAMSTAAIGVLVYLYRMFRRYMWPWIVSQWRSLTAGDRGGEDEFDKPDVQMREIVTSQVYELHDTISTIKSALDQQQAQISQLAKKDPEAVEDLRKEMNSIKKLLLSKDSFPAAVPTQLPSWQIRRHERPVSQPITSPKSDFTTEQQTPKLEEIPPQEPSTEKTEEEKSEETVVSDDASHVIISHEDLSQDIVSHESRVEMEQGYSDSSDSASDNEIVDDGENKLYSECLGAD